VVKADIINYFRTLAMDFEGAYYGFYFMEIANYYARENTEELHMLKLLYQSLRALENNHIEHRLVRRIFELKAMVINGEYPNVFVCLHCGTEENLNWINIKCGGTLCESCAKKLPSFYLDKSTLYTMQYIITTSIEKVYTFAVSPKVLANLEKIMNEYMNTYIDKTFQSLTVLEENQGFALGLNLGKRES
ncbi:MAG: DNA repair protein RecO, partial [Lachnospiraceae bacterium]